ncbi:MAG: 50S ribosomal protein L4 [Opitutales bacterium]|nr:50S ribosomal protein L4 [Opitutales bacterium]MBQ9758385.1 50S ribosomal protein L4 [Opitutales bacterium]
MKLKVYTVDGSSFSEKEFEAFPVLEEGKGVAALKQAVIAYQANLRQGNAKTKDYGEVAGSGKKQGPQKGSGGARHGDKRAPQLYKGGVVFGPRPRDWSKAITTNVKKLALSRALVDLASEGGLNVIERIESADAKTKTMSGVFSKVFPKGKLLVIADAWDENAARATRNIERVSCVEADTLNALDLVSFSQVLVSEQGLNKILERVK